MSTTISISKEKYDELIKKASLFEKFIETEELTKNELKQIKDALKDPIITKKECIRDQIFLFLMSYFMNSGRNIGSGL